ncbi:hypothetical protein HMPREF0262_02327 [Clostridium sp. ATCC 29733]|nr:hypothetical protein HMPREF0262_02327 [Clostridium sp. ATCC 29733]
MAARPPAKTARALAEGGATPPVRRREADFLPPPFLSRRGPALSPLSGKGGPFPHSGGGRNRAVGRFRLADLAPSPSL